MTTEENGAGAGLSDGAIGEAFDRARREGRAALVTYLMMGYPAPEATPDLVAALAEGGADVIELGVPFSDPVADGPVIQRAGQQALAAGMTPAGCLEMVAAMRRQGLRVPLVLMGYYNPILAYGLSAYARDASRAGVDGLIVPDLPLEEAAPLGRACADEGLDLVLLAAPTTRSERLAAIAAATRGFLYLVARLGITGAGTTLSAELRQHLQEARRVAHTPVAVGFGIAAPEQAAALAPLADGIIVGTAVVERAAQGPAALRAYTAELRAALACEGEGSG